MAGYSFRSQLANLESEYCRLEAENRELRGLLGGQALVKDHGVSDCELAVPVQVFQQEGVHQMAPDSEPYKPPTTSPPEMVREASDSDACPPDIPEAQRSRPSQGRKSWSDYSAQYFGRPSPSVYDRQPIFPDAEEMKASVRRNIAKHRYDVADFYKDEGIAQQLARNHYFEIFTLTVIGLNSIWISIDTDHNDADLLVNADWGFQIVEHLFCGFFFFEIIVRFSAFANKFNCVRDAWFMFDSVLVFMMVVETWVVSFIITISEGDEKGAGKMGNVGVLRIARLLRLTRMARMARLLRAVPELVILVKGMAHAARSVFFTLLLLLILLYVFAIAFKQLMEGSDVGLRYFRSVPESMNTLWLYATLLEEITTLAHDVQRDNVWMLGVLYLYILGAALTVMNMLIGVLCQIVSTVATTEKEESAMHYMKAKVQSIFWQLGLDEDRNGMISRAEFSKIVQNKEAARAISDLGVDVEQLVDMADHFFTSDELTDYDKELSFEEFMNMVTDFRTKNVATVKDMMHLQKFIRGELEKLKTDQMRQTDRTTQFSVNSGGTNQFRGEGQRVLKSSSMPNPPRPSSSPAGVGSSPSLSSHPEEEDEDRSWSKEKGEDAENEGALSPRSPSATEEALRATAIPGMTND